MGLGCCSTAAARGIASLTVALVVTSCTPDAPSSPDPGPGFRSRVVARVVGSPSLPPRAARPVRRIVVPITPVDIMPKRWREVFVVPYGSGHEELGTSRGGERGTPVQYGPEYGAPAPDGSWWFLDVDKLRLAHYDAGGGFLEAVRVPTRLLVDGDAFQWTLPHVLSDGTVVAFRLSAETDDGAMLRLRDGVLDEVPLTAMFSPTYDDGTLLYGTVAGRAGLVTVDQDSGEVNPVPAYRLPSGAAFTVEDDFDRGVVRVDTATGSVRLATESPSGSTAHMGVQVRAGADDSLHLYLLGTSDDRSSTRLVGYLRIGRSGGITRLEPLASPDSSADRGSPAQLVVAPAASIPMLVYVMPDGVHVYRRTG